MVYVEDFRKPICTSYQPRNEMTGTRNSNSRQNYLRQEYIARINRVIDYIEANIDKELSLVSLAKIANFS
jgi:transcriptional regulator GlxA family with amidase domain